MQLSKFKAKFLSELSESFSEREVLNQFAIVLEKILNLNRAQALLAKDRQLDAEELKKLDQLLFQLKKNKPLDYIFRESIFFGREFYVDERVLIPRPETEELLQWILEEESKETRLLDIGSGCGCIPITLALESDFQLIHACDISADANQVAQLNAKKMEVKIDFIKLDILHEVPDHIYDVVVSNPPYVRQEELNELAKNVVDHEPKIALAPPGEPLLFYRRMIAIAPEILKKGGKFYWEIHEDFGKQIIDLLKTNGFKNIALKQDNYGRDRLVRAIYSG